jgi:hypothetical protein
MIRQIH